MYKVIAKTDPLSIGLFGDDLPVLVFRYVFNFGVQPLVVLKSPHDSYCLDNFCFDRVLNKKQVSQLVDSLQQHF